ncbi:MAG: site-specific integrase [Oscillospiraceae bacterium]|nr:site-specific integrase [Oscillospiraceae bacterium]
MSKAANGSGTVYKPKYPSKNLPFRAEVWITDLSRPQGKRRISKNFKKRTDAEKWRSETLLKYGVSAAPSICDSDITLSDWLEFWINTFSINIRDSTRTGYECYIRQHIARHPIGKIRLKDLTNCHLQTYIQYLQTEGNLKGGGMSEKTIRSMILMIRKSLHAAIGADLITKNAAEFVELPKLEQKEVEYLTLDQIKRLIDESRNERWGIFFPLAFFTGCRIGELSALRQSSLRCEGDIWYIAVEGSLNRVKDFSGMSGHKTVLRIGPTKNGKNRQIPILEELVTELKCHFAQQRAEADILGTFVNDPFVFCNELGDSYVDPSTLRNWAKDIAAKVGILYIVKVYIYRVRLSLFFFI